MILRFLFNQAVCQDEPNEDEEIFLLEYPHVNTKIIFEK